MRSLFVILICGLVACGSSDNANGRNSDPTASTAEGPAVSDTSGENGPDAGVGFEVRPAIDPRTQEAPPTIRIGNANDLLELTAWTTCWTNYCADGAPPQIPDVIEGESELFVEFPIEGWNFSATAKRQDEVCGRTQTTELAKVSPTVFSLPAQGESGDYVVDVFGRGDGGDVIVTFGWATNVVGAFEEPTASLSLLANNDGAIDSYGIEFSLNNLAEDPNKISADVTVTAENGKTHQIEFEVDEDIACDLGEGNLFLRAPVSEGQLAAALGDGPFVYDVLVVLDGVEYRAVANWPADEDQECAPCVPLTFDPPLPAAGGGS